MVYRGCVLFLEKNYAVVMTEKAEYIKVNKKNGLVVGAQILFLENDVYREKRTTPLYQLKYAAVFAILLLAAVFQFYINDVDRTDKITAAIVTLDINPSIEIEINNEGEAISLIPLNVDGAVILNSDMTGEPIDTVISELLKNAEAKEYFDIGDNYVLISMTPLINDLKMNLSDIEINISNIISDSGKLKAVNIVYASGDRAGLEEARLNRISAGRYYLYEELKRTEPGITIETIRNMELKELFYRQRYGLRFGDRIEASGEAENERILYEDTYEHILLRERRRVQSEAEGSDPDTELGNENRSGKGSRLKYENRRLDVEGTQPGEEYKEAQNMQSGGYNDGEQQNQVQNQNGVLEESEETTGGEIITPRYVEPGENKSTEKGKESDNKRQDNKRQDNKPSNGGNRK